MTTQIKDKLYCYALGQSQELPECKHRDHFGYCTALAKEQCLTLRDMLEYAARRRNIAELELKVELEPDPEKRMLYRAALIGAKAQMKGEGDGTHKKV